MIGLKIEKAIKLTKLIWLSKNIKYMLLPNSNFYNLRQIQFTCTIQIRNFYKPQKVSKLRHDKQPTKVGRIIRERLLGAPIDCILPVVGGGRTEDGIIR